MLSIDSMFTSMPCCCGGAIVGGNVEMSATGPISPLYAKLSRNVSKFPFADACPFVCPFVYGCELPDATGASCDVLLSPFV